MITMVNTQSETPRVVNDPLRGEASISPPTEKSVDGEVLSLESIPFKAYLAWLNSAEAENPGFSHSMNAATAAAAFIGAVKTLGARTKLHHLRLSPPPGLVLELSDAVSKMTASLKTSIPTGAVSQSARETGRKPSGRRQKTSSSPLKGNRSTKTKKTTPATKGSVDKSASPTGNPVVKIPRDPRQKILAKALRSFRGSGIQANLARKLGLTETVLREKILALTEQDIKSRRQDSSPSLAYTGIFDDVKSWSGNVDKDEWLATVARRSKPSVRGNFHDIGKCRVPFSSRPTVREASEKITLLIKDAIDRNRSGYMPSAEYVPSNDLCRHIGRHTMGVDGISVFYNIVKADNVSSPATVKFSLRKEGVTLAVCDTKLYLVSNSSEGGFIVQTMQPSVPVDAGRPPVDYQPRKRVVVSGTPKSSKA
jgi:hypothetical protein